MIRRFHLSFSIIWPIFSPNHMIAKILTQLASFSIFLIHLYDKKQLVALASFGFVLPFGGKTSRHLKIQNFEAKTAVSH
jgi:hypothetical protein